MARTDGPPPTGAQNGASGRACQPRREAEGPLTRTGQVGRGVDVTTLRGDVAIGGPNIDQARHRRCLIP